MSGTPGDTHDSPTVAKLTRDLSAAIRTARESRDWTQEEAADAIDAERKTIWYWESEKAILPLVYVKLLAGEGGQREARSARLVLRDALGLGDTVPDPLSEDIELRTALTKTRELDAWPRIREAILSLLRTYGPSASGDDQALNH